MLTAATMSWSRVTGLHVERHRQKRMDDFSYLGGVLAVTKTLKHALVKQAQLLRGNKKRRAANQKWLCESIILGVVPHSAQTQSVTYVNQKHLEASQYTGLRRIPTRYHSERQSKKWNGTVWQLTVWERRTTCNKYSPWHKDALHATSTHHGTKTHYMQQVGLARFLEPGPEPRFLTRTEENLNRNFSQSEIRFSHGFS